MISTRSSQSKATGTPRSLLQQSAAAIIAAAALYAPAAQAGLVTFEDQDPNIFFVGDSFTTGGMRFMSADTAGVADVGTSLSGAIFDSSDIGTCGFDCPVTMTGKYYAGLSDGVLWGESARLGGTFRLSGFDASFIGLGQNASYPTIPGYLRVMGWSGGQNVANQLFAFDPKGSSGFEMARFDTNFANLNLDTIAFFAYGCTTSSASSCKAVGNYNGQFALDNVELTHIPEPATMMTMLLGLAGMGAAARRRRSK